MADAPITQDVLTIPRKMPEGPVNLVGLTRAAMRDVLIAHGTPEKAGQDAGRPDLAVDISVGRA